MASTQGEVTQSALRNAGLSGKRAQQVVRTLDALALTKRDGPRGGRRLAIPLPEALHVVRDLDAPLYAGNGIAHDVPVRNVVVMQYDPSGLFAPGARFPKIQVLVSDPMFGEWPVGAVVRDRQTGVYYRYDGWLWQEIGGEWDD